MFSLDCSSLKSWFLQEKRDLPWRHTTDPYAIWISEIMLQQTQVAVVIPYYLRWMEQFSTIQHLANASLDEVIKAWEGLGYYSRARHLHEAAGYLVKFFNGQLPSEEEELKKIKGLGPYTIGAILSFAFHQKKAAVDGNVLRVLSRYFGLEDDIAKPATLNKIRHLTNSLLPDDEPWIINEALIELGATICQRKAQCSLCPLKTSCVSFQQGWADRLPIKSKKVKVEDLYRVVVVIRSRDSYLIQRGKKGAIMSDLHEFPYFEVTKEKWTIDQLQDKLLLEFGLTTCFHQELTEIHHGFTRYHVCLYPFLLTCQNTKLIDGLEWMTQEQLKQRAFSSGHRKIFQQVQEKMWPTFD